MTAIFANVPSYIATKTGSANVDSLIRIQNSMNIKRRGANVSIHPVIKNGRHQIVIVASSEVFAGPRADDAIWLAFLDALEIHLGFRVD